MSQVELGKACKNIVPASPQSAAALPSTPTPSPAPASAQALSAEKDSRATPSRERPPLRGSIYNSPAVRSKQAKDTSKVADRPTSRGIRPSKLRNDLILEQKKGVTSQPGDVSDASSESSDFFTRVYNVRYVVSFTVSKCVHDIIHDFVRLSYRPICLSSFMLTYTHVSFNVYKSIHFFQWMLYLTPCL